MYQTSGAICFPFIFIKCVCVCVSRGHLLFAFVFVYLALKIIQHTVGKDIYGSGQQFHTHIMDVNVTENWGFSVL